VRVDTSVTIDVAEVGCWELCWTAVEVGDGEAVVVAAVVGTREAETEAVEGGQARAREERGEEEEGQRQRRSYVSARIDTVASIGKLLAHLDIGLQRPSPSPTTLPSLKKEREGRSAEAARRSENKGSPASPGLGWSSLNPPPMAIPYAPSQVEVQTTLDGTHERESKRGKRRGKRVAARSEAASLLHPFLLACPRPPIP
jgi:hypothetical protein